MKPRADRARLVRERGQVFLAMGDGEDRTPVKPVWTRPISGRGDAVSLMGPDKKEVLMLRSLDALDAASRRVAEEELARRYLVPRIQRVIRAQANFGIRYWHVETDLGERRFAVRQASKNVVWLDEEHLVLRDTLGCRYEIRPLSGLDPKSRAEVDRVV